MVCDKCGSENTQTLKVVYEGGTQDFEAKSQSAGLFGLSGIGIGGAVTKTSGSTSSKLAQRAAPPAKSKKRWAILGIVIGLMMFSKPYILSLILFSTCGYWLWSVIRNNRDEWPKRMQVWSNSWICHKCGNIYQDALPDKRN